jgi:hypothetical protein
MTGENAGKYRAAVVGLGWMGFLYDLGRRDYHNIQSSHLDPKYDVESDDRPLPEGLDLHRTFHYHDHPGKEGATQTYAGALADRPEVELVAGADRSQQRLQMFGERYGVQALYTNALEMFAKERLDIVAIATNTKGRSFLTVEAAKAGVKGIFVDKPMAFSLEEADAMVAACAERGIALVGGATTASHPSFARARDLVRKGAIGQVKSVEAKVPVSAQHQDWSYFLDSDPVWVCGVGDVSRQDSGSSEFRGQGLVVCGDGTVLHIRDGAPQVCISGDEGEIRFERNKWHLLKNVQEPAAGRAEWPWPEPQFQLPLRTVYCLDDLIACMEGRLDEPKNSGRLVARAMEVEIALKQSAERGGERVELPLVDRGAALTYDWFR